MEITLEHLISGKPLGLTDKECVLTLPDNSSLTGIYIENKLDFVTTKLGVGVYAIHVCFTGQYYFGSTNDLYRRLVSHRTALTKGVHKNRFFRAIDLISPDFEITYKALAIEDREVAYKIEGLLIDMCWGRPELMNIHQDVKSMLGIKHTDETRERMRQSALLRPPPSTEIRNKISQTLSNRQLKPTHALKISESNKRRWKDPEFRKMWAERKGVKQVMVSGLTYDSVSHAARAHGIGISTAHRRVNDPKYADWFYVTPRM